MLVYRVQDRRGRGPFKPGQSERWLDPELPPGREELTAFGLTDLAAATRLPGWHYGCGCRTIPDLARWFSPTEQGRLALMGYSLVAMTVNRILLDDGHQVLFARRNPLSVGAVIMPWDQVNS